MIEHSQLRAAGQAVSRPREGGRRAAGVNSPVESQAGPDPKGGRAGTQGAGIAGRKRQPLPTAGVISKETYIRHLSRAPGTGS